MIQLPEKIKQRLANLQQSIYNLENSKVDVINIFLESIGEDEPIGRKWRIEGESVVFEKQQEIIEQTDTPKE